MQQIPSKDLQCIQKNTGRFSLSTMFRHVYINSQNLQYNVKFQLKCCSKASEMVISLKTVFMRNCFCFFLFGLWVVKRYNGRVIKYSTRS